MYPHKVKLARQLLFGQIKAFPKVTAPITDACLLVFVQTVNNISARVDRIARRAGLSRLCIGEGKNGSIRYLRKEVVAYEEQRLVPTK